MLEELYAELDLDLEDSVRMSEIERMIALREQLVDSTTYSGTTTLDTDQPWYATFYVYDEVCTT